MENHIPDCEDPSPPIQTRSKIKTKRSPRLSKNVDPSNDLAKGKNDYFGAKTQVKQKPTTLSRKKTVLNPYFSYTMFRDLVKKYTTVSSDPPDADDYSFNNISLHDENNSASKPFLGYHQEVRETKGTFSFNKFFNKLRRP